MKGSKQVTEFIIVTVVSGIACALVIAWGLEVLRLFPFTVLGSIIAINNTILPAILGPVLMGLLYGRVKKWGLLWTDVMEPSEVATGGSGGTAALLVSAATLSGWLICLLLSIGAGNVAGMAGFAQFGKGGAASVIYVGLPFVAAVLASLYLGRARTDLGQSSKAA